MVPIELQRGTGVKNPSPGSFWCELAELKRTVEEHLGEFHGLVVPFGTNGMVQVDRPLVLVPLAPRRSEDPLLLVPLVPLRSEDPLLLVPLVPRTPTCPNLSHFVVPLVLSQFCFRRFFFRFLIAIHL